MEVVCGDDGQPNALLQLLQGRPAEEQGVPAEAASSGPPAAAGAAEAGCGASAAAASEDRGQRPADGGGDLPSYALRHVPLSRGGGGLFFLKAEKRDWSNVGKGGGFFERQGNQDRQDYNSDEESIDEFGRKKRRKRGPAAPSTGSRAEPRAARPAGAEPKDLAAAAAARGSQRQRELLKFGSAAAGGGPEAASSAGGALGADLPGGLAGRCPPWADWAAWWGAPALWPPGSKGDDGWSKGWAGAGAAGKGWPGWEAWDASWDPLWEQPWHGGGGGEYWEAPWLKGKGAGFAWKGGKGWDESSWGW